MKTNKLRMGAKIAFGSIITTGVTSLVLSCGTTEYKEPTKWSQVISIENDGKRFKIKDGIKTFDLEIIEDKDVTFDMSIVEEIIFPRSLEEIGSFGTVANDVRNLKIRTLVIPEGVKQINKPLNFLRVLETLTIPSTVRSITGGFPLSPLRELNLSEGLWRINENVFKAAKLKTLNIPSTVNTIGSHAFYSSPLTTLNIARDSDLSIISDNAFTNAFLSGSFTIPNRVKKIGELAFYYSNIENLYLGQRLSSIGTSAFYSSIITEITIPASVEQAGSYAFGKHLKESNTTFEGNRPNFSPLVWIDEDE